MKAYEGLVSPTFGQHVYTSEGDFRDLRWVTERGINLRGFRLELKGGGYTLRQSGVVLIELMDKKSRLHEGIACGES